MIKQFFRQLFLSDEADLNKDNQITVSYIEALENQVDLLLLVVTLTLCWQELSGLESYQIKNNPRYKNVDLEKLLTEMEMEKAKKGPEVDSDSESEAQVEEAAQEEDY